jgi:hypothetical protein
MSSFRKDISTFLVSIALIFGLLSLVLWTTFPFGCGSEECPIPNLNQSRLELLLLFGTLASTVVSPATILVVHNYRVRSSPFSSLGKVALTWPAISCFLLFTLYLYGALLAPAGVGISLLAVIISLVRRLKSDVNQFHWGDLLAVAANLSWTIVTYFYILRFWELFGD